jgi:hypothetical protein
MRMDRTGFSRVNLQYFTRARDLARLDAGVAAACLGIPDELARVLERMPPEGLAALAEVRSPLVVPRAPLWWWSRLVVAAEEGSMQEVEAVLEHAPLLIASY